MSWADVKALLPLTIVGVTAVVIMLTISFYRNQTLSALLTAAGLGAGIAFIPGTWGVAPYAVDTLLILDRFGLVCIGLFFLAALGVTVLAHGYLEPFRMERSEFYILLLLATDGAAVLATSSHFISFFLGLELLSVSLYVMVAYLFMRDVALEAGLKYVFLAATTSAFLLFGMALLYAEMGVMEFSGIAARLSASGAVAGPVALAGFVLILTGVGFKLSLAPFHMWTPDIYQGSPAPVAGYLATISKGAVAAVLLRLVLAFDLHTNPAAFRALAFLSAISMLVGNLLALRQSNLKRLLAYSSIAHMGYLLIPMLAGGELAVEAVTFYLVTYFVTTLAAFGTIGVLSTAQGECESIDDCRGLFWRRPLAAMVFTTAFFSLAGLPLTAGFIGKFYLLFAGVGSRLWFLVFLLIANSALGLYYYLRVVVAMYSAEVGRAPGPSGTLGPQRSAGVVLGILLALLIFLGLLPRYLLDLTEGIAKGIAQ